MYALSEHDAAPSGGSFTWQWVRDQLWSAPALFGPHRRKDQWRVSTFPSAWEKKLKERYLLRQNTAGEF